MVSSSTVDKYPNLSEASALANRLSRRDWIRLRFETTRNGLAATYPSTRESIIQLVKELVTIANTGLINRGLGEEIYLDPIYRRLETNQTPATLTRNHYQKGQLESVSIVMCKRFFHRFVKMSVTSQP